MATTSHNKQSDLQKLKAQYPEMEYLDGRLYLNSESDEIITEDADNLIEQHYYWAEKLNLSDVSAERYIVDYLLGYEEAFKNV